MQPFTSLRVKLILVFVGLMLIAITGMALYGYFFTRTALYGQALERSTHQVHLQAESMVSSLKQAGGDALYLSALRSLHMLRTLRDEDADDDQIALWRDEVAQDFLTFSSVRPMYQALRYIDADGREIVGVESDGRSVSVAESGADRSDSSYFQQTMALDAGGVYVSTFTQDPDTAGGERPLLHYALRLPDDDGLVLVDLHAGWLLRNLPADPGQDTWVMLDQDGNYLVYPEPFDPAQSGVDISAMLGGGLGNFETGDSVFVYDTVHPSETTPDRFWVIYRQTPKSLLYADVTTFYAITTMVILGAALLALALSLVASERILKPLLDLERQTAAFGHGGPAPVLPARLSRDEIGTLTRTFCEMAAELERQRGQEHRLIEKLIDAQEEERKLVAYDLHDGLIQQLVGARYYLNNTYEQSKLNNPNESGDIKLACDTLTEAIIEGRRIVEGLRPAVLDDLGLAAAIEEVAQASTRTAGWELALDVQRIPTEPDKTVSVTVFRIAQEALNNIRKHADAHHVHLTMSNGSGIDLVIRDDGKGFDAGSITGEGRGLGVTTMKERAALIHGTCEIDSTPGGGTRVHVWVPLTIAPDSGKQNEGK
ncbi:MAG: HAMP domain-containing protein [Anaerolineae bacterium]|nr:HAMP domain-containing protein [Anaerolineae bacterium]